jgi:hypothetical protein
MRPEDRQNELNNFSDKYKLIVRAIDCCKEVLNKLSKEGERQERIGVFEIGELILDCNGQSLIFRSHRPGIPFIRTEIGIFIKDPSNSWFRGLEPVGRYELDTNLDNEDIDDWLTIDKSKNEVSG